MTDKLKHELNRAETVLCRHLEDLNDQVEQDGGRIKKHETLDAYKDCLNAIKCHDEIMSKDDGGASQTAAKAVAGGVA